MNIFMKLFVWVQGMLQHILDIKNNNKQFSLKPINVFSGQSDRANKNVSIYL